MKRIVLTWGRHITELFYGPKCQHFKDFAAALAWAREYKEEAGKQRPGVPVHGAHYPTGRKNEKPVPLEDF